jgi:hypothetical protein
MSSIVFGSGKVFMKDPTSSQVYQVGILSDVSLNFEGSSKNLYGNKQFPVATVMTSKKVTGKASFAQIDGRLISALMAGTVTAGRNIINENVSTGSTLTVSPSGTGFVADLGAIDAAGNAMSLTASAPSVGTYSQSGGTYTFNNSEPVGVTVAYTYSTGSGNTFTVTNADMGTQTNFSMYLQEKGTDNELFGVELLSVVIPNLNFAFKNEDFSTQDLSFEAQATAAGSVAKIFTA